MKKLIPLFFTFLLASFSLTDASAQTSPQAYNSAIGVRVGLQNGVTYKTWIAMDTAVDISLNYSPGNDAHTLFLTGLYEKHNKTSISPGLLWYYGGGASIGSRREQGTTTDKFLVSLDGVVGLDYKFAKAPINLSLDWKPAIEITPKTAFNAAGLNLSIRYTF